MDSNPPGFDGADYTELWYSSLFKASSGENLLDIFRRIDATGDAFWFRYEDGTNIFLEENASKLWVTWPPHYSVEDAATYLMGPVMAVMAQLRNRTGLHASAVAIDGRIVALLGAKGAGKSTTAAAFARAGYPVVADDLVLLSEENGHFIAEPAYPNVRLWPSAVEALFGHADALPTLTPTWEKRGLDLTQAGFRFQEDPLPLAALYILGERTAVEKPYVRPVAGNAALMQVVLNSWGHYAKPSILAGQLAVLGRLSSSIPIREVVAHDDARRLPELCQMLVDDVRGIPA
jgi:hypothetical protein